MARGREELHRIGENMQDGFVKVAAITPKVRVADVTYNVEFCLSSIKKVYAEHEARVIVLPELCITGYTCEDLFWQDELLDAAERGLASIALHTFDVDALVLVGLPVRVASKLYNCAAVLYGGEVLGLVPKQNIPMYNEFYEGRHFTAGPEIVTNVDFSIFGEVPFGANQLFSCESLPELVVAAEICEDLWVANPPSVAHAMAGATLICNLSASPAMAGKAEYRRSLVCGYMYAGSGEGESTTDLVFSGHNLICENGHILADTGCFTDGVAVSEIDVAALAAERRRLSTFFVAPRPEDAQHIVTYVALDFEDMTKLTRFVDPRPFVPANDDRRAERCEEVLSIQAHGLATRLAHTGSQRVVIGISGGLYACSFGNGSCL